VFSAATVAPANPAMGGVSATDRQPATDGLSTDFGQPYPQISVHNHACNTLMHLILWIFTYPLNIMVIV
jgi:hypothetical protein